MLRVYLVGSFTDARYMPGLCRLAGVIYVGVLSLADTHRLIAESFALVNSSLSEGVAASVLEVVQNDAKSAVNY